MHKTSFEMTLFDDEYVKKKLTMLGTLEAMFDDARNEFPQEYYWFSDKIPLGTRIRVTLEELPEVIEPFDAIVRIKKGASIGQDHAFMRWPICYPPISEYLPEENPYRPKDPDMLFAGDWNGKFWNCVAEGYGDTTKNGDYGSGSIFVFSYDGVEIVG